LSARHWHADPPDAGSCCAGRAGHAPVGAGLELLEAHQRAVQARIAEFERALSIIDAKLQRLMLRVVAKHADRWSAMAATPQEFRRKSTILDRHCAERGRDPTTIGRSVMIPVHPANLDLKQVRETTERYIEAGAAHGTLLLFAPYPEAIVPRLVDEVIAGLQVGGWP
jgi:hypothetical protein